LFLAALMVMPLFPLFSRDVEIIVEDGDLGLPLEGAVIHTWDNGEYPCDKEGRAVLAVPGTRQVTIRIRYPGYMNGRFVIPPAGDSFTVPLRLAGVMENRELVIEARREGNGETRSGRSVELSGTALTRTAEIGIIEDVMTSIKLLPGVGYAGFFNAFPSIRGGEPGDLTAVFDGFYIDRPYHWGGGFSIFDPKMVESARLSHGVFSSRYGHTISGLLEVSSKKPSSTETELELGLSSSATNLNLSVPLGKGGIMAMGKVTYWDPFVWAAKQFVPEARYLRVAPYIRSGTVSAYYRFTPDLEWTAGAYFGGDGIGVLYENERRQEMMTSYSKSRFDWDNKLGFFISGLTFNPRDTMALKTTLGTGFLRSTLDGGSYHEVEVRYSPRFLENYQSQLNGETSYIIPGQEDKFAAANTAVNFQGRADFDWDLGRGFLFAAGAEERYTQWLHQESSRLLYEERTLPPGGADVTYVSYPVDYTVDVRNRTFVSSAYTLLEYETENRRFGTELGLRADHLHFVGRDFTIRTLPACNPRLNFDFGLIENRGPIEKLSAALGTGLFSSINENLSFIEKRNGIGDLEMKQNRSWTSVAGLKIDLPGDISFNIETYFKYVFNRAYRSVAIVQNEAVSQYFFDGKGIIWGFDLILRKFESRFWDGWLSYSFNHARYRDPQNTYAALGFAETETAGPNWYYPSFHRFHNLNLVFNIKPIRRINVAFRFGFASGAPKKKTGEITSYPVVLSGGAVIEKWKRTEEYSDTERSTFSIPLDIKFSLFLFDKKGKVRSEIYLGAENLLSLVYTSRGNTTFNSYTGQEDEGSRTASYELPIPLVSLGLKWSY
jgi:hypothetical protein